MTSFEDREKGYETKFSRDQDMNFRVQARRDKLLGLWAADLLKITGDAAETYARDLVMLDIEEPGDQIVVDRLLADFEAKGVEMSEHLLRKHMDKIGDEAHQQIKSES